MLQSDLSNTKTRLERVFCMKHRNKEYKQRSKLTNGTLLRLNSRSTVSFSWQLCHINCQVRPSVPLRIKGPFYWAPFSMRDFMSLMWARSNRYMNRFVAPQTAVNPTSHPLYSFIKKIQPPVLFVVYVILSIKSSFDQLLICQLVCQNRVSSSANWHVHIVQYKRLGRLCIILYSSS